MKPFKKTPGYRSGFAGRFINSATLKTTCLAAFLTVSAPFVEAQVYNPAILPDNPYGTILWPNSGTDPNSSSLDYTLETGTAWGGPYVLKATAADFVGAGYSGIVYVDDNEGLGWYGYGVDPNPGYTVHPDVAICDNLVFQTATYPHSYLIPIVYNEAGTIYMQIGFYTNPGNGGGGGCGYFTYAHPIQVSATGVATSWARIDAVSEYSNPNTWGSPTTDKVTITWAEAGSGHIVGCAVSINSIIAMMPSLPANLFSIAQYQWLCTSDNIADPDVAMVERYNAPNYEDVAIFSYLVNSIPQDLVYIEWNVSTSSVGPAYTIDNGHEAAPRIDAIDNFNYNSPLGPNAYFTVVTTGTNATHAVPTVLEFNNLTPPGGVDVLNSVGLLGVEHASDATVACGPTTCGGVTSAGSWGYNIASGYYGFTVQYFGMGLHNTYLAEQIDWSTGAVIAPNYYEVPVNPVTGHTNSIASSNNEDGSIAAAQFLFSAWDDGTTNIWSKLNMTCPFSFRQEKPRHQSDNLAVTQVTNGVIQMKPVELTEGAWSVSPNPVSAGLVLSAGSNMSKDKSYTYCLTDVTGRRITSAPLAQPQQSIDVSQLAPGLYMLTVYENSNQVQTMKVVKE